MGRGDVKKTKASIKVKNKETNKKLRKKFRGTGKSFEEKALQSAKAQPPNKKAIQNVSNRREEEEKRIKAAASYLMEEDEEYRDVFRRDEELEFEKGVRKPKSFAVDSEDKAAPLPIKSGDGRVVRVKHQSQVPDVEEEVVVSEDDKMDGDSVSEEQVQIPPEERIATFKSKVAEAAVSVLGNPEEYLPLVSGIEAGLKDDLEAIRSIAIASLGELFVDIIPGYRIKPPVEASNGASKLSKEVRKLWNFESSLLRKYKAFVEILKKELKKAKALKSSQNISLICKVSVKAACKLLVNAFHFNQALEVVEMLVPLINSKNGFFNEQCRESVVQVFRLDTAGDASLQIVSCIHSIVKSDPGFIHPFLLEVLLSLPLRHIEDDSYKAKDAIQFRHKKKKSSMEKELARDLDKAEGEVSQLHKSRTQSKMLEKIFQIYFCIMEDKINSSVLSFVLQGLSRFAPLMNVDLVPELVSFLSDMLSSPGVSVKNAAECVLCSLEILSKHHESIMIDVHSLHRTLYRLMNYLPFLSLRESLTILKSMSAILLQRKEIENARVLSYVKRMLNLAAHCDSPVSLGLLNLVIKIFDKYSFSSVMLEEPLPCGLYRPDIDDPDQANPQATCAWEIERLSRSFNPFVASIATELVKYPEHNIPVTFTKLTAAEILEPKYALRFNPAVSAPKTVKAKPLKLLSPSEFVESIRHRTMESQTDFEACDETFSRIVRLGELRKLKLQIKLFHENLKKSGVYSSASAFFFFFGILGRVTPRALFSLTITAGLGMAFPDS